MTELISKEQIKRQAIDAANRGDEPTVCHYLPGSEMERIWKDAFYIRVSQLDGKVAA